MTTLFSVAALAAVWFCCLKLAAVLVRPLLASRRPSVLLIVMLAFPHVFIGIGSLVSFGGDIYCWKGSYSAIFHQVGSRRRGASTGIAIPSKDDCTAR
jgi:hypothetical protein